MRKLFCSSAATVTFAFFSVVVLFANRTVAGTDIASPQASQTERHHRSEAF
jgi:hypothetical protein